MKKLLVHEWVKNGNLDTRMICCKLLRSQALPFVYLGTVKLRYKDFQKITVDIMTLSRNNSNIRSFALSLGQKRKMTAECQDMLNALRETVQQGMTYKATR